MDLIDRYVHRVRFQLPASQRDDIARELAADLRAEVHDREIESGRPLATAEISDILRRWGHPILVAGRYQPARYLIGPTLFPVYWLVLKLVAGFYLIPWLAVWIGLMILNPAYRAAHSGLRALEPVSHWWGVVVGVVGTITVVFAVLERTQVRLFERWDPSGLPAVRDRNAISRFNSIVEIVAGTIFVLFWAGWLPIPVISANRVLTRAGRDGALLVTATASFAGFYWPVLVQASAGLLVSAVNLFRPWWTTPRALARLATNLATAALATSMLSSGPWVKVELLDRSAAVSEALTKAANLGVFWLILGIAVGSLLIACIEDGRRLYRLRREPGTTA